LTLDKVPTGPVRYRVQARGYQTIEYSGEVVRNRELRLDATLPLQTLEVGQAWVLLDLDLEMRPVAPGTFMMGSTSGDGDEQPVTRVTLTRPYWLGKTEVTQAQWQTIMGANPSENKGGDLPVEKVSWEEAIEFCRKLTARERASGRLPAGYAFTLPTEAQWEYACRAGTTGDYSGNLDAMAWYAPPNANIVNVRTHPVGRNQPSAWGFYDMHGNVAEWCLDWYGKYPGGSVTDPTGPKDSSWKGHIRRGGAFGDGAKFLTSSRRSAYKLRAYSLGFRLALVSSP
jgi:formylglycine-generating enzyme required for sulfatase activity